MPSTGSAVSGKLCVARSGTERHDETEQPSWGTRTRAWTRNASLAPVSCRWSVSRAPGANRRFMLCVVAFNVKSLFFRCAYHRQFSCKLNNVQSETVHSNIRPVM